MSWNGGGSEHECIYESCNICKGPINFWTVSYANTSAYDITLMHLPGIVVKMKCCCRARRHGTCLIETLHAQDKPNRDDLSCPSCGEYGTNHFMDEVIHCLALNINGGLDGFREYQKLSAEENVKFKNDAPYQCARKKEKKGKNNREKRDDKKDEKEDVPKDEPEPGRNSGSEVVTANNLLPRATL